MEEEDLRNQIIFWLREDGDFSGCTEKEEMEEGCQRLFPALYAALVAKRRAKRLFLFELHEVRYGEV